PLARRGGRPRGAPQDLREDVLARRGALAHPRDRLGLLVAALLAEAPGEPSSAARGEPRLAEAFECLADGSELALRGRPVVLEHAEVPEGERRRLERD